MKFKVRDIAAKLECQYSGNGDCLISGVAPIETADKSHITFLANPKYEKFLTESKAGCIIVSNLPSVQSGTFLVCANPYYAFAKVSQLFSEPPHVTRGISEQACVAPDAEIGEDTSIFPFVYISPDVRIGKRVIIYPGVFIGEHVTIGDDTLVYPNVTILDRVTIGKRVIIHSTCVLGSDGYGFATEKGIHHKIPQIGDVVVEDDVEFGAGVTIDRGTIGTTRIGKGTKFDNQVHVAHNVTIGEHSLLVAQVGISGSTSIGKHVTIAGKSGLAGHISVGDNVTIAAGSAVTKSVKPGQIISGVLPARDHRKSKRMVAALARLPELMTRFNRLERLIRTKLNISNKNNPLSEE